MKKILFSGLLLGLTLGAARSASAETFQLTIHDNGTSGTTADAIWTLLIDCGSSACSAGSNASITLSVAFQDPTEYLNKYVDSVGWSLDGYQIASFSQPTFSSTNPPTSSTTTQWQFTESQVSNSGTGCSGNDPNSLCGSYLVGTPSQFGPLTTATTMTWAFGTVTFEKLLGLVSGTSTGFIRASYNNLDGSNYTIFSPSSRTIYECTDCGDSEGPPVPEPASMLMIGAGLLGLGKYASKRRAANS